MIAQQGLTRLHLIHCGVSTLWASTPPSFVDWSALLCFLLSFMQPRFGAVPLDIWLGFDPLTGFSASVGLLRTVSGDVARVLTGILPAEFQIRQ